MKYNVVKTDYKYVFNENKKTYVFNGYAFMDEHNHCIIVVFGENKRDSILEYLCETPS